MVVEIRFAAMTNHIIRKYATTACAHTRHWANILNMTHNNRLFYALALAFGLFFCWQCTKPTPFGAELLDDQVADFFGDSLDIVCTYERASDTTITADRTSEFDYFLLGQHKDPKLGTTTVDLYANFRRFRVQDTLDIVTDKFDSVMLVLAYDTRGFYGDTLATQTLVVSQLAEVLDFNKGYKASDVLPVAEEIGRIDNFQPKPRTRTKFLDTSSNALKLAHIKVPLSEAFGRRLLEVPKDQAQAALEFHKVMKGIKIESRPVGTGTGSIMGFNLNNRTVSFIRLYHTRDTVHTFTDFAFGIDGSDQQLSKFMHIEHDYSGTNVEAGLNQPNPAELYMQGMGGTRLKIELPATDVLKDVIINKAELQFFAENSKAYPSVPQVVTYRINSKDKLEITSDVDYSLRVNDGYLLFGGYPRTVTGTTDIVKYQLSLTDYLQTVVKTLGTDTKSRTLYIDFYNADNNQLLSPSRSVIYGPTHPDRPMKLRLKYTKV